MTAAATDVLAAVRVEFACPACGAEGYEETLDGQEVERATQVVVPCDDCSARIVLDVDVRIEVEATPSEGSDDAPRVKIACINWTHPDAPHALIYLLRNGEAVAEQFVATWDEAMALAPRYARTIPVGGEVR